MSKTINFNLDNDDCLVLFEYLSKAIDDNEEKYDKPDIAEKLAFNKLLGVLEKELVEPINNKNYAEDVEKAKARITNGYDPKVFGQ